MKIRTMHKLVALVTGVALAFSFPVASSVADKGGIPHNGKAKKAKKAKKLNGFVCPEHPQQAQGPRENAHRQGEENGQGHKCGLQLPS